MQNYRSGSGVFERAIAWAGRVLGAPIAGAEPLPGGLTSTMLALTDRTGQRTVLRLMTEDPWRRHGAELTSRERAAQLELATTPVPAPSSVALDAAGEHGGIAAHLMNWLPGTPASAANSKQVAAMAAMLALIHDIEPSHPFRPYQSWAPPAKWVVPEWSRHPGSWKRAFDLLAAGPPDYTAVFLHRDFSHRNLLWRDDAICGVVDWVETSSGPAWLDVAHAATNLAISFGPVPATDLLRKYAALTQRRPGRYWLVLDAAGFLPVPDSQPLFGARSELEGLDDWLHCVINFSF